MWLLIRTITDIGNTVDEANNQECLFKDMASTCDVIEIENDQSTPVKSNEESNIVLLWMK